MKMLLVFILLNFSLSSVAQDKFASISLDLEKYLELREEEKDYSELIAGLEVFIKDPLNINKATEEELSSLFFLSEVQILGLIKHRSTYSEILSLLELQLIPAWDESSIRLASHFLISGHENGELIFKDALQRSSVEIFSLSSFSTPAPEESSDYLGSGWKNMLKVKCTYSTMLSLGVSAEKDVGERFAINSRTWGYDFLSAHFFHTPSKFIQAYILGDYQLCFGQGLSLGSGISLGKSADISSLSRNLNGFRPYRSLNESEFLRGAAIKLGRKNLQSNICFSRIKTDGRSNSDGSFSIYNSGYHRSSKELELKGKLAKSLCAVNFTYRKELFQLGLNMVLSAVNDASEFVLRKNLKRNTGLYYKYLFRNLAFAGELAIDQKRRIAVIQHLTGSLGPKLDICLLFRNYPAAYSAQFSNAISSGTSNSNEKAFYSGISFKPGRKLHMNAYAEISRSEALKYQTDAPSVTLEQLIEFHYQKNRNLLLILRYKNDGRDKNQMLPVEHFKTVSLHLRRSLRFQLNYKLTQSFEFRLRYELIKAKDNAGTESGNLLFQDFIFKPLMGRFSCVLRLASFQTESWDARLYAYESEMPNSYSVPAFNGQGFKYYILINYSFSKKLECWLRISTTQYAEGEIPIETAANKTEFKFQLLYRP